MDRDLIVEPWLDRCKSFIESSLPAPDLHRVACPTLLVWGARDNLVPLEDGFQYARRLRSPLRILPACGHLVVGEQPRELAHVVQQFLASPPD